jgi:hypothetical protein
MSGVNYANSSVHKSDLQLIENYAASLSGGGGASESGFSYVMTNDATVENIPATVTTVPISFKVSPTITYAFNWKSSDWNIPDAANNAFVYTGTSKKFVMDVDLLFAPAGASSAQIFVALYKGANAISNAAVTTAVVTETITAFTPISFSIPFTAVNGDSFTLRYYGSSTGINLTANVAATIFSPVVRCPAVSIECREVKIL